jgi:hypothetical protein
MKAPRVFKQMDALADDFIVDVAGDVEPHNINFNRFIDLRTKHVKTGASSTHHTYPVFLRKLVSIWILLKLKIYKEDVSWKSKFLLNSNKYWTSHRKNQLKLLLTETYDVVIVHHIELLPLATRIKEIKHSKLIWNAHEYYPLQFDNSKKWLMNEKPWIDKMCENELHKFDVAFVVAPLIARKYEATFKIKTVVVPNDKPYYSSVPSDIDVNEIKIISHGASIEARKIENMIEVMDYLPSNYTLTLMLMPVHLEYHNKLKELVASKPNIKIVEGVNYEDIVPFISKFDIGLFLLEPTTFNYKHALPNKFFEFIQAKLAIAIGPSVEMQGILDSNNTGIIASDFEPKHMAKEILKHSVEDLEQMKKMSLTMAKELSSGNTERLIYENVIKLINHE